MFDFLRRKKKNDESIKFIKSMTIFEINDIESVSNEMKEGHIVILNLARFIEKKNGRTNTILKRILEQLTYFSKVYYGDMAQLGKNYVIMTPGPKVQFWNE